MNAKRLVRQIPSIVGCAMIGAMLGVALYLAVPDRYTSTGQINISSGTPNYPDADKFVNTILSDTYSRKTLSRLIREHNLYGPERETGPVEDVLDDYRKHHLEAPSDPAQLPKNYFEQVDVSFSYRDSTAAQSVATELFQQAIKEGKDLSQSAEEFRGFSLVQVHEPKLVQGNPGEYTWTGRLRLDAPVNLSSNQAAIESTFREIKEEIWQNASMSELVQRPTFALCTSRDLDDCLPRVKKEIGFQLNGGVATVSFTAHSAQLAQKVVSAVVTKCVDYGLVKARETNTRSPLTVVSAAILPESPDGPNWGVIAAGLALAGAWLRIIWLD